MNTLATRLRSVLARDGHEVRVCPRRDTGTVVVDLTAGEAEKLCEMVEAGCR